MAASRMQFDFSFGPAAQRATPRPPSSARRMLVVADLGGRRDVPLTQRKPMAVDIDNLDSVLARVAPSVEITLDGLPLHIEFASLDDFHPDRLFARLSAFDVWRRLREELRDPVQYRRAAAALGLQGPQAPAAPPAPSGAPGDAAADIERLLGRKPAASSPAATSPAADALENWLRTLIAPHISPATDDEQRALLQACDLALTGLMRRLLHDPAYQAREASWLGIDRLVRGLELGEDLELFVLDAGLDELRHDAHHHASDLGASAAHALMGAASGASAEAERWSLVIVDFAFGADVADVHCLAALGAVTARAGAPLLASAAPALAGAGDRMALAQPRRWLAPDDPALAHWQALRSSPMAPWIGLALPRVLMRLPYGQSTDRIASFAFEEMPEPRDAAAYLWGGGAVALALLAGQAVLRDPQAPDLSGALDLDDLPSHVYSADGAPHQQPCAELLLGEEAGQALLQRGLMPLLSYRNRNAARLLRWQSVADPPRALLGLPA